MGKYYDLIEGLKTTWTRWREPELLKWVVIEFAVAIAMFVIVGGLLAAILGADILIKLFNPDQIARAQAARTFAGALAGVLVPVLAVIFLAFMAYMAACFFFFQPRIMRAALAANGAKVPDKMPSMIDWLMLHIRLFLVTITCWYDKKLLIPAAAMMGIAILFVMVGFFANAAFIGAVIFGIMGWVCWMAAMAVHNLRTGFATWMFLRGDGPESGMPIASNTLVKGQTLELFMTKLCVGAVFVLAAFAVGVVRVIFGLIPCVGAIIDMAINLGFQTFSHAFNSSIDADIFLFFDKAGPAVSAAAKVKAKKK